VGVAGLLLAGTPSVARAGTTTPTAALTAAFADRQITPDETSVLTFTITNGGLAALPGLGFRQPMPKHLEVTSYGLRKNCGSPTVTGVHTLKVAGLTIAPQSVCTVEVVVMPSAEGMFEVSPEKNARITGNLTPGQGDVLRVRNARACADSIEFLCTLPLNPAEPRH
jgi:hypothetical protein